MQQWESKGIYADTEEGRAEGEAQGQIERSPTFGEWEIKKEANRRKQAVRWKEIIVPWTPGGDKLQKEEL